MKSSAERMANRTWKSWMFFHANFPLYGTIIKHSSYWQICNIQLHNNVKNINIWVTHYINLSQFYSYIISYSSQVHDNFQQSASLS